MHRANISRSEYCLASVAVAWSAGFQLGVVWNPTAALVSHAPIHWFNTADPMMGVADTRILVPQSPLGDGILVAFDAAIAAFLSLQIRDFIMGAIFSYQAWKVALGFSACAFAAALRMCAKPTHPRSGSTQRVT